MTAGGKIEGVEGIEDVVDELLQIPPQGFTEARNAAAKRLRADGRRDAADAVKGLPRPSLSLWALNRLAHEQASLVEAFAAAAERLRQAHRSGGDIRAATGPQRDAEAGVVAAAAELARAEAGAKVTETVMRGLRETLRAAATDAKVAAELRDGRLLREPEALSMGALLESMPQRPAGSETKAPAGKTKAPGSDRTAERGALKDEIAGAKKDATGARDEARTAADTAARARREAERAQKLADQAQARSDEAAERLAELQQRLKDL